MPIYDFRCRACGAEFEQLVRGGAPAACPRCAGVDLEREVSLTAPRATTPATIARARRAAAREGHFSHYAKAERAKLPK